MKEYDRFHSGIPYYSDSGLKRWTVPDILITYMDGTKELIEVKAQFKLKFDNEQVKLKIMKNYAACKGWDFSIWTEKELNLN